MVADKLLELVVAAALEVQLFILQLEMMLLLQHLLLQTLDQELLGGHDARQPLRFTRHPDVFALDALADETLRVRLDAAVTASVKSDLSRRLTLVLLWRLFRRWCLEFLLDFVVLDRMLRRCQDVQHVRELGLELDDLILLPWSLRFDALHLVLPSSELMSKRSHLHLHRFRAGVLLLIFLGRLEIASALVLTELDIDPRMQITPTPNGNQLRTELLHLGFGRLDAGRTRLVSRSLVGTGLLDDSLELKAFRTLGIKPSL